MILSQSFLVAKSSPMFLQVFFSWEIHHILYGTQNGLILLRELSPDDLCKTKFSFCGEIGGNLDTFRMVKHLVL